MVNMIASWGGHGAGKSVVAEALATALTREDKNVVVIGTDTSIPTLPLYLPLAHPSNKESLGELLSNATPCSSPDDLLGFIHLHPRNERIGYMGLTSGQSVVTYSPFEHGKIVKLLTVLDSTPFDYVIFDCGSNPAHDTLTLSALQLCNHVLRIISPDIKGLEFEKAHLSWLSTMDNLNIDNHIRIINATLPYSPTEAVLSKTGKADFMLPFSTAVYNKFIAGDPITNTGEREGIIFEKQINKLVERVL